MTMKMRIMVLGLILCMSEFAYTVGTIKEDYINVFTTELSEDLRLGKMDDAISLYANFEASGFKQQAQIVVREYVKSYIKKAFETQDITNLRQLATIFSDNENDKAYQSINNAIGEIQRLKHDSFPFDQRRPGDELRRSVDRREQTLSNSTKYLLFGGVLVGIVVVSVWYYMKHIKKNEKLKEGIQSS